MLTVVISLLISLLGTLVLSRLISKWLMEILSARWYNILLWPGVVVHEFSHLLGALFTFTKVMGLSLWPKELGDKTVLGSVTHEAVSNPVVLIVISALPVFGGALVLWALTMLLLGIDIKAPLIIADQGMSAGVTSYIYAWVEFIKTLWLSFNFQVWQSWIFIYLSLTIAAHLAPSSHDLGFTAAGITAIGLLIALVAFLFQLSGQTPPDMLGAWVTSSVKFFLPLISYALAMLILLSIVVGMAYGIRSLNRRVVWWG